MPLPTPNLDDLRFQRDLVNEARRRIVRYCPEWTEYNVSDPGVTLIELFSWMTEQIVYRLNRVPEKNYVKFMELLGFQLMPAGSARTQLTFWLSAALPLGPEDATQVTVPQGMEISTAPGALEQDMIFTTDSALALVPPRLAHLRREADFNADYVSTLGGAPFLAFGRDGPKQGDCFYLGYDADIGGYILRLAFACEEKQAPGISRDNPPLVWECWVGDRWVEVMPSTRRGEKDTTGGLNNPQGALVLYLPLEMQPNQVHGITAYWVRCTFRQRSSEQGSYAESPRIKGIATAILGGKVWATHAQIVRNEPLGFSDGEPGQIFHLQHAPVLAMRPGETIEVEELRDGELVYVPWQRVADFAGSGDLDRHFTLDEATGEIAFGPAVRDPTGKVHQYGRVVEAGRRVRTTGYRHGGGSGGNLPPYKLTMLRSTVPYVDHVTNLERATGGLDQEDLEHLKLRARQELRAQQRAVTAEDYESLARASDPVVGRVKCRTPGPGNVELLVVPRVPDALRAHDMARLAIDQPVRQAIQAYLDQYRLLATTLLVREPDYLAVKVQAQIAVSPYVSPEEMVDRVVESLGNFLTPLPLDQVEECGAAIEASAWEGWPFGRNLYLSEIYAWIQRVPGVKHVLDVKLCYRPLVPSQELMQRTIAAGAGSSPEQLIAPPAWIAADERVVKVGPSTLICSLDHEIEVVSL